MTVDRRGDHIAALEAQLAAAHAGRMGAETAARTAVAALRRFSAEAAADSAAVSDDAREEMRTELAASVADDLTLARAAAERAQRELRDLRRDMILRDLISAAGCRGSRIASVLRITRDAIDWLDEVTPIVRGTADFDVADFYVRTLTIECPELLGP